MATINTAVVTRNAGGHNRGGSSFWLNFSARTNTFCNEGVAKANSKEVDKWQTLQMDRSKFVSSHLRIYPNEGVFNLSRIFKLTPHTYMQLYAILHTYICNIFTNPNGWATQCVECVSICVCTSVDRKPSMSLNCDWVEWQNEFVV